VVIDELDDVPVVVRQWGGAAGLLEPKEDTVYIVSGMVRQAMGANRRDVVAPATGPMDGAIRDNQGNIVAVTKWDAGSMNNG
jgi:hypothetical protein